MRFGFVTCVQLGLACMEEIYEAGGSLELVLSLPDERARDKSGRIYVDDFCARHAIPVVKSRNVNDAECVSAIRRHDLDWLFIIGWSQIARRDVLEAPKQGVLGIHPTLLPVGRGRAAIPWAILKGLDQTGITLFKLDEGVDTGPILAQHVIPIGSQETATELYDKVTRAHRILIREVWPELSAGTIRPQPQDNTRATQWPGRTPEDGRITPSMTVAEVERLVRAVTRPYPGAFFDIDGRRLRVWAGKPRGERPVSGYDIRLADGAYTALQYEWEALPGAATS